jgi:ferredoxin
VIKSDVRADGLETENREEMSELKEAFQTSLEAAIEAAAAGCPVEVIKFDKV